MPTSLVTGANRGLGLALTTALAERGHTVIAACRRSSPELDALEAEVLTGVDLATDAGEQALAAALGGRQVDLLLANAGVFRSVHLEALDIDEVRRQFEVNALGVLRTVRAALGSLGEGSKIGVISTLAASIGDNGAGGEYAYRMSKAALNMAGVSLARDLAGRGVSVAVIHPGRLATEMNATGGEGSEIRMPVSADLLDPLESARDILARLDELTLETSGSFMKRDGAPIPW